MGETTLALSGAVHSAASRKAAGPDPLVGKIIGGYKLKEVVGEGGMGKVYRATQLSLHRDVALKILRNRLAKDKAFRELFVNEAQAAAQLVHPNVVQVYDAGREGDITFFSMEFIGQGSVEEILARDGKIAWEEAILMVLEAAHGLEYAEGKGIVHRDIKPDNLMINDDGRVKIADLGLAKRGASGKEQGIIGTPHFIPPEQALGKEVDSRADIYSLGATFFRMITGKTLFSGQTAKEIVLKHIKEPPPAASSMEKTVPDDLDMVLAKMLAKDPERRYGNTKELIAALEEVCAAHGIKGAIIRKGVSKKVLIPLLILLLGAAGALYYFLVVKPPETISNPAEIEAREKAEREAMEARRRTQAAEKDKRRARARGDFSELRLSRGALNERNRLKSVFDTEQGAAGRKQEWEKKADEFEAFAKTPLAREFEGELQLVTKAQAEAKAIRDTLRKLEASAQDKREKTNATVAKAEAIDKKKRSELSDLRVNQRYERAAILCEVIATGKPAKEDPFSEIVEWEWVSPIDSEMREPATETPAIMEVVDESRKYFRNEGPRILDEARQVAKRVLDRYAKLPDDASDQQVQQVIDELAGILSSFPDPAAPRRVSAIQKIVGKAIEGKNQLERRLANVRAERLRSDRLAVRDIQRRQCSLDPEQFPNSVMDGEFGNAIRAWNNLLVNELQTDRYRAFVKERIEMLRWCEYLFARFGDDLRREVKGKEELFVSRELASVPFPDKVLTKAKLTAEAETPDKFGISRAYKKQRIFRFGRFPMDWVHHTVFLYRNEPRWKEVPPVVRFALGAFCFETMQYKEAQRHFLKLLEANGPEAERYVAAAKALRARAAKEEAARAAWEALCQEIDRATTTKGVEEIRARALAYAEQHEGTIFYLDTMYYRDQPKKDFFDPAATPEIPKAPPPPAERPGKQK